MKIPTKTLLIAFAVIGFAVVVIALWATSSRTPKEDPYSPTRPPTPSDTILSELINNLDADMRSIEIGSWFVSKLRAQIMTKTNPVNCDVFLDLAGIANAIPGANDTTKAMTVGRLQRLVTELFKGCKGSTTKESLVQTLNAFEDSAFKPGTGLLLTMPGYSLKSSKPLPK